MADNQTEFWRRVLNPPTASGVNSLVEFSQNGSDPIGALIFPIGTTAQRPSVPVNGMMRFNTTITEFEFYNGSWEMVPGIGGVSLSELSDADADTKVIVENSTGADDDIIAMILGDSTGMFDESANAFTFSTSGFSIDALNADSGNTAGVALSLSAGDGNLAGVGADLTLASGTGGATGAGGDVTINASAGGATSGAGGSISLTAGTPPISGAAGTISVTAGGGGSGVVGGDVIVTAGDSGTASVGGAVTLTAGDGGSTGGGITLTAGAPDGSGVGGPIAITAGAGASEAGGSITITAGSASEANGAAVTIVGGAGTGGGDGGAVIINSGSGDTTDGIVQLQIDSSEAMSVEVDGTLSVPAVTVGGPAYETLVTDDDDIPNRKFVVDADTAVAAGSVPLIVAPIIANIFPTPKAGLGGIGPAGAIHPPGSFAFVTDDATGPTPFVLAYVDGTSTWVRADTTALIS